MAIHSFWLQTREIIGSSTALVSWSGANKNVLRENKSSVNVIMWLKNNNLNVKGI